MYVMYVRVCDINDDVVVRRPPPPPRVDRIDRDRSIDRSIDRSRAQFATRALDLDETNKSKRSCERSSSSDAKNIERD